MQRGVSDCPKTRRRTALDPRSMRASLRSDYRRWEWSLATLGRAHSIRSRQCSPLTGEKPDPIVTLGVLSLVIWTLILITTVKYVSFAMRFDNDGEGGILALMALLGVKRERRPIIVAVGLFGAALIYGDGAITPAISVLSAVEGLNIATPTFHPD